MARTDLNKEGILQRLVTPKRLIEAGLAVGAFALPALSCLAFQLVKYGNIEIPSETLGRDIIVLGTVGLGTSISAMVLAEAFFGAWDATKNAMAKAGTSESVARALDAGVPVVEEVNHE